jgi:hypothetical protein
MHFARTVRLVLSLPPGKSRMQDPAVTLTWTEWLNGDDEDHSCWFDFMEAPPVWKTRWFRIGVAAASVCFIAFFLMGLR